MYDHFLTRFGGSLRGATVQYCCWSDTTPYRLSALTGTFYANPVGLSINPASGEVDLGGSQPGTYEIVYAIQFDCQSIILKDTITVLQGGSIGQQSITACDWNFGDPNTGSGNVSTAPSPTHNFSAAGTFDIRCIATFACGTDTSTLRLTIDDCDENPCTPTIPNVFTPNSDGINELFRPTALCTWPVYELEIYNRWGQKVFATTSQSEGWDGTVKGNESPDGTYIYRLTYKNPKETQKTLTGAVILIR